MENVCISLGSNLGDRYKQLREAIGLIEQNVGTCILESAVYESDAWGFESEDKFYNACIVVQTEKEPEEVLDVLQEIERKLGRKQNSEKGYQSRSIDLDIVFFGKKIINNNTLIVPHPHFRKRMFVLEPLFDVLPNFIDPLTMLSVSQLKESCDDQSELTKIIV